MPEISLGKSMEKPIFWKLPVHPGGEIYTDFDEESDFQIENNQMLEPEGKNKETDLRSFLYLLFSFSSFV